MILNANGPAKPTLDRKGGAFIRHNQSTREKLDELKKLYQLSLADLMEGAVGAADESGWFLDLWIAKAQAAQNANRKNPQPRILDESSQPELTPDDAATRVTTLIKDAVTEGLLATEQIAPAENIEQSTPKEEASNLWTDLVPAVTALVGAENFETWLSCVRFLSASETILLSCPNTFFQEYLTEHYTPAIEQALQQTGDQRTVVFEVVTLAPVIALTAAPRQLTHKDVLRAMLANVSTLSELEAFETRTLPQIYQARIREAAHRVQRHQGDSLSGKRKTGFNDAQMAEEMAVLRTQRVAEEQAYQDFKKARREEFRVCRAVEQLRVKGNPQHQRQYARPSHFDSDGPLTRADLKN